MQKLELLGSDFKTCTLPVYLKLVRMVEMVFLLHILLPFGKGIFSSSRAFMIFVILSPDRYSL